MAEPYDALKLTITQVRAVADYALGSLPRFSDAELINVAAELDAASARIKAELVRREKKARKGRAL
jgi:hypothetical protein